MITINHYGDFKKLTNFLEKMKRMFDVSILDKYGREGVAALSAATPIDSGKTASSWISEIKDIKDGMTLTFNNTNIQNGVPIAIILQYGHGTRNGGWVEGRDYINPAIQPVFDKLANEAWKEVIGS